HLVRSSNEPDSRNEASSFADRKLLIFNNSLVGRPLHIRPLARVFKAKVPQKSRNHMAMVVSGETRECWFSWRRTARRVAPKIRSKSTLAACIAERITIDQGQLRAGE